MYRLSRCVLLAHEDKLFQGAMIASLSIPWGETKGDDELGGYHLVWTRDLVQSATALLATGQSATPLRALIWLACIQKADGDFPQNSWIDGRAYWSGVQLDEIASPILLAWRLRREDRLPTFDPWHMIAKAARYLLLQGPVTGQERWEEQSGYSPSTLAVVIAALVCAAEFARSRGEDETAEIILDVRRLARVPHRGLDGDVARRTRPRQAAALRAHHPCRSDRRLIRTPKWIRSKSSSRMALAVTRRATSSVAISFTLSGSEFAMRTIRWSRFT